MARIRTIKPEFFTSADICDLTPLTRLFYISLWCESDRAGRLEWKPKTLRLRYFPADNKADFEQSISELVDTDLIELYEIDGKQYCQIPTFEEHQVINNRENESKIPENTNSGDASGTRESGVKAEGKEGRKGREGKGETRGVKVSLPKDFKITDQMREFYKSKNYPLGIEGATEQWLNYIKSDGRKYVDWYAAWQGGMAKQNEWFVRDGGNRNNFKVVGGQDNRGML